MADLLKAVAVIQGYCEWRGGGQIVGLEVKRGRF